jgi:hypothetical protein
MSDISFASFAPVVFFGLGLLLAGCGWLLTIVASRVMSRRDRSLHSAPRSWGAVWLLIPEMGIALGTWNRTTEIGAGVVLVAMIAAFVSGCLTFVAVIRPPRLWLVVASAQAVFVLYAAFHGLGQGFEMTHALALAVAVAVLWCAWDSRAAPHGVM